MSIDMCSQYIIDDSSSCDCHYINLPYLSAWQQHDVQELCRVMFDALEINWKDTDQSNLINELYQGKLKDYVKCLEVIV